MVNKIAAIDYSMSCPCICLYAPEKENDDFSIDDCYFMYITTQKKFAGSFMANKIVGFLQDPDSFSSPIQRYDLLSDKFIELIVDNKCVEIAIEGYSYASKGLVFNIGENTGILKLKLHLTDKILHTYEPRVIKKFATGKGTAKKEDMYAAFYKETGVDLKLQLKYTKDKIESPVADIVDSYYICKYHFYSGII